MTSTETSPLWNRPWPPGWTVRHVGETGSTNADLAAGAHELPHRSVLVADHQTAGRGRLDRRWDQPAGGGLLVSILLHTAPGAPDPAEQVRRVSLAALDACRHAAPASSHHLTLKWPNDLLLDGRKLAGVLAQLVTGERPGAGDRLVVGVGINTTWAPEGAARLGDVDRPALLAVLLAAYDRLPPDRARLAERYRSDLGTIGQQVRVERPDGHVEGRAIDVTLDGALTVLDGCGITHRVHAGDVVHLRPV